MTSKQRSWRGAESERKRSLPPMSDDSDSSSEIEDDDAEGDTPQIEKDFFKTLSFVKSKDPRIYDQQNKFYESEDESSSPSSKEAEEGGMGKAEAKDKAMFLRDYERKIIVEKGGQFSEDESDDDMGGGGDSDEEREKREASPTYVEEQKQIRESFQAALESDESESDEDLLQTKIKTKQEKEEEERDYKKWLKGEADNAKEGKDMGALRSYWTDPNLEEGEKFLRNYILNKEYINKEEDSSSDEEEEEEGDGARFSEEERLLEEQDNFERKFNFRFEEPDQDFIKRYPRTVSGSVRRKDTSRAERRQDRRDRKEEEKEKKKDELKHLKNVKKQEILNKLDQLREATGNATVGFNPEDLEDDFDPEKYDKMMENIFNEDYDAQLDEGMKPELGDDYDEENYGDLDEGDDYGDDDYEGEEGGDYEEPHCDDPDFIMDADYDPSIAKKSKKERKEEKKQKKERKKAGFADAVKTEKPTFDPADKTFDEYMEEYYKLDYEDLIDDLPCRFKYRTVMPNDFGLSVAEVLSAKDKELNQWVSVKKTSQYRTKDEEVFDIRKFRKRAENEALKNRIFLSLMEEKNDEEDEDEETTTQEEATSQEDTAETSPQKEPSTDDIVGSPEGKKKKKRRKKKRKGGQGVDITSPDMETESSKMEVMADEKSEAPDEDEVTSEVDVEETRLTSKKDKKQKKLKDNTEDASESHKLMGREDNMPSGSVDESMEVEGTESRNLSKKRKKRKRRKSNTVESVTQSGNSVPTESKVESKEQGVESKEEGMEQTDNRTVSRKQKRRKRKKSNSEKLVTQGDNSNAVGNNDNAVSPKKVKKMEETSEPVNGPEEEAVTKTAEMHSDSDSEKEDQNVQGAKSNGKQEIGAAGSEGGKSRRKRNRNRKRKKKGGAGGGSGNKGGAGGGGGGKGDPISAISNARLKAYGINPRKIRYQLEYQKQKKQNQS